MIGNLVVLDFETTGLSPESGDRITEVAAIRINADGVAERFESLVNSGRRLSAFIIHLTGITQKMVDSAPPVRSVMRELVNFIGRDAVIAHQAQFDDRFFRSECDHVRIHPTVDPFICSKRIAQRVYPDLQNYKLSAVAESLGLSYQGRAHRAGADALLTAEVVLKMAQAIRTRWDQLHVDSALLRRLIDLPVSSALANLGPQVVNTARIRIKEPS